MKNKMMQRVKNCFARFVKSDAGAVMMEYVLLILLVVACVAGAALYLGRAYKGGLDAGAKIITDGDPVKTSGTIRTELNTTATQGVSASDTVEENIHNTKSE